MDQMKYSCPMHPEVTSNKPGNCPKCGMALTKSKKSKMAMQETKMYTCPMHSDVTSNKPGQCSKCGMDLKQMPAAAYSCPMNCGTIKSICFNYPVNSIIVYDYPDISVKEKGSKSADFYATLNKYYCLVVYSPFCMGDVADAFVL